MEITQVQSGVSTKHTPSGSCSALLHVSLSGLSITLNQLASFWKVEGKLKATCRRKGGSLDSIHMRFSFEKKAVVIYPRQLLLGSDLDNVCGSGLGVRKPELILLSQGLCLPPPSVRQAAFH